jgi:glycyl-tRNA synthetase beta subunit
VRITRDIKDHFLFDTALFAEPVEKELAIAFNSALATIAASCSVDDLLNAFLPMIPTINHFFEAVMVMVEDKKIRENRLGLLQQISALSKGIADFSKLEGF